MGTSQCLGMMAFGEIQGLLSVGSSIILREIDPKTDCLDLNAGSAT